MLPTTSNHSELIVPKPWPQLGRFWQAFSQRKRPYIYLDISKMGFTLGKLEILIFDYTGIILGSWKADD